MIAETPNGPAQQRAIQAERLQARADVPDSAGGRRVDQVAAELFPEHSRSRLGDWLKAGALRLDGRTVKPSERVLGGEVLVLDVELAPVGHDAPEAIDLDILHEDAACLVLNKPPGLTVHPGAGQSSGTLVNALLHREPALAMLPRAGLVHRLDKDTSGALVVARTLAAHTALTAALARRELHRQYIAVVQGVVIAGDSIDAPIGRHPRDRLRKAVREDGRPATTHYRVRERWRDHSLLELRLETGRTHQIRVHLAHIGFPIVGDPLYGGGLKLPRGASEPVREALRGWRRQALHAERLAFASPDGGQAVDVLAPPPADLSALVDVLRAG
ncbi:23S rRNA pseudouridine(1911/1915/1917) synthase RluD [Pseudofulvimonas gallinarii]|jgi:23S rRNA pseudouridine1911/1915/1917 synthase|uniref:Pseudouridine synthase n=1 Tax=Pseudofulvimonas gallinarii TaxID=634155 RepID=A0A4R3LFG2_9GAMM|nr:23S rRNA pseudouridine(1911/1915/1917) synthase RluD [Pseudofulvimonas gallinarii]TCS98205.1 ribosomal large subunit pseudouridine synthase D [Pseudofulvimonas gallinarii]THD13817.1 23S rRNA pseudouridine(1911/1915/1917) synthase [Pseudofulvimonas gallinarii]